jgi:hypothetical protein
VPWLSASSFLCSSFVKVEGEEMFGFRVSSSKILETKKVHSFSDFGAFVFDDDGQFLFFEVLKLYDCHVSLAGMKTRKQTI